MNSTASSSRAEEVGIGIGIGTGPASASNKRSTRPPARGTAAYSRRSAVKACQVCRARRTKCDNLKPSCSFCLKVGAACIQSPVDLSSFDPASLKILERLDELENLMKSANANANTLGAEERSLPEPEPTVPVSIDRIVPPGIETVLLWSVFGTFNVSQSIGTEQHASIIRSPTVGAGSIELEEPRRINELLDRFFSFVHVKNPVLDEASTRRKVLSVAMNGIDWSPESCLCLLICALGSIATPFGPSIDTMPGTVAYANAQSFFHAAQKRLGVLMSSDNVIASQCLFLSGVYMMCIFRPMQAWRYFIQALASCQQFGFLSPPFQKLLDGCQEECEQGSQSYSIDTIQQAIYWSSWKSKRELRNDLHLPDFSLSDKEHSIYPPFFPSPPTPRATTEAGVDPAVIRERSSWYFYLAEISLRRLTARIGAEFVALGSQFHGTSRFLAAVSKVTPRFEEQAQEWVTSLPECLSFEAPYEQDDICRFILRGHFINLLELIYWPFLSAFLNTPPSFGDDEFSTHIIELTQKGIDNHLLRIAINRPGFKHRHHGTIPMIRACSRSALILIGVAKINSLSIERGVWVALNLPEEWRERVAETVGLLQYWSDEYNQLDKIQSLLERSLGQQ